MDERNNKELRRSLIKQIILSCLMLSIQITIFFISAGHFDIPRAWIFFSVTFVYLIVSTAALYKLNPELLVQRLKRKREGSKRWDEILMRVSNLMVLIAVPAIAGLDIACMHAHCWVDGRDSLLDVSGGSTISVAMVVSNARKWRRSVRHSGRIQHFHGSNVQKVAVRPS